MSKPPKRLSICIINPRFEPSCWGYEFSLPLLPADKRCWTAAGALPLLAALVPPGHDVELIDETIDAIDFDSLDRFDVIGVTGMILQRDRMFEILAALGPLPAVVAVGGPFVSVTPESFHGRADVLFVGEAEQTWPAFLADLAAGNPVQAVYKQLEKTDMTLVPTPRYDLLKARHYVETSVQFSRGCPFQCEFCDIITIFGRRPRLKTPAQLLTELDAIRSAGFRSCFLVDDNFIGNRIAAKQLLIELIAWQRANGYPLHFHTEASVDLAEYPELIDLMVEANILQVFVGIESPRRDSLSETKKNQNNHADSLLSRISRIRDGGLVVTAGFIVGFDNDDERIFDEQFEFIQQAGLAQAMAAILSPIPSTPLYDRLAASGRLVADSEVGFMPMQMTRDQLRSGHRQLLQRLFVPTAFFTRLYKGYRESSSFRHRRAALVRSIGRRETIWSQLVRLTGGLAMAARLLMAIGRAGHLSALVPAYVQAYFQLNRPFQPEAIPIPGFVMLCVLHWHYFLIARHHRTTLFGVIGTASTAKQSTRQPLTQIATGRM